MFVYRALSFARKDTANLPSFDENVWAITAKAPKRKWNDLVDEFWLKIFPVTLGRGKRLFAQGTIPAAFTLLDSKTSPTGVIVATLKRAGELKTGSF